MIIFDGELEELAELKHEKHIVFIKMAELIEEAHYIDFLSPEGVVEYLEVFAHLKEQLDKLWIVLKPTEAADIVKELNNLPSYDKSSYLLRAIFIIENDKSLFLARDNVAPLLESLEEVKKYW